VLLTHRYYDAGTGRFVTRDPIGYKGGINLYGFAGNNPVNESDPNGTSASGEAIIWLVKLVTRNGIKYKQLIRPVNIDTAMKIRNAGGNILVEAQKLRKARKIGQKIEDSVPGRTIEHGSHNDPDIAKPRPHFQTNGANGHTFFSSLDVLSILLPMQFQFQEYDPKEERKRDQAALNNLRSVLQHIHH